MKHLLGAIAIAVLAAPAHADDVCDAVQKYVAAAPDRFEAFRGESQGGEMYATTASFPLKPHCMLTQAETPLLACRWDTQSEGLARYDYGRLVAHLRACLPDWTTAPPLDAESAIFELMDGLRFHKTAPGGEVTVGAGLARATPPGVPNSLYSVSVAFVFKPSGPGV